MPIEEPIYTLTQTRLSFYKDYLLAFFLVYLVFMLKIMGFPIKSIGIFLAGFFVVIFILLPEINRLRTTYSITKSQIITEEGIFSRKRISVFFDNVADFSVHQNFVERSLKYGTLIIGSNSGRDYMELKLKNIKNPKKVVYDIERLIKEYVGGSKSSEKSNKENEKRNIDFTEKAFNDLKDE